jgi:uncharacterized membrane protein YagU involved in acid resistance
MRRSDVVRRGLLPGALAGLVGGLVFGAAMSQLGLLPTIASLVRAESDAVGLIVHFVVAAIVGAGFGLLVWHQRPSAGETLFWGLAYGSLWWFLGPLTLLPLFRGAGLAWDVHSAQDAFPALLGHVLYGAGTGLAFVFFEPERRTKALSTGFGRGALMRGALAGLLGAWLLGRVLDAQGQLLALSAMMNAESLTIAWLVTLLIGLLAGLGFAVLYPHPFDSAGAGLTRGMVYGFFWWVAGALTLLPLLEGAGLAWSLDAARQGFATLPGYLLFGSVMALAYQWLDALVRGLFSDAPGRYDDEGVGTRNLRAAGRGALAGLVGGMLFTVVMVQVGFLPTVANLIGSTSALTGFLVHLVIAVLVGVSYGLLFRRQSYDISSALGWGASYGFLWWVLGSLTLLPYLLGATPQWTVGVAVVAFPALVGHLAYGTGLALVYFWLETRYNPWWISHTQAEATRVTRRKEQVRTSAPALWVLVVVIALTVPVMLGM